MKKFTEISKAEMKKVTGGVPLASYCEAGMVLASCRIPYQITMPDPGGTWGPWGWTSNPPITETHYVEMGGCMLESEYQANAAYCTLLGSGGPYAV